jgi:hypothetical protein
MERRGSIAYSRNEGEEATEKRMETVATTEKKKRPVTIWRKRN